MKKILLCCAAGMSTSLLVNKMKAEAEARGLEVEIWAEPLDKASVEVPKKKKAEENRKKIEAINMVDYGMMNGKKVLDQALALIG